jgi:hypothetical protein
MLLAGALNYSGGTRSGVEDVTSSCPLLIWLTGIRPSKTGRTFLPGVSQDDIDQNQLLSGLLTACGAFITYWRNNFTLTTPAYVCNGTIFRRALGAADDIVQGRISPIIGTLRGRQRPV